MRGLLIALLFASIGGFAQESETRSIGSFKSLKVAEGIDVYLKKGNKETARIEVTGIQLSDVIVETSGDYLKIHMRDGRYPSHSAKVYITYVSLEKLSASSAANIFTEGVIKSNSLTLSASSAGSIDISVDVQEIDINASSAADIELQGKAKRLTADVSSAGEVDAYDLETEIAEVNASSAGSAKVNASKEIEAKASSGGSVRYRGNPARSNTNTSSGGSIKKSS